MQKTGFYPKTSPKATFKFRTRDGRPVRIEAPTLPDLLRRLRERCPDGTFRALWEARA